MKWLYHKLYFFSISNFWYKLTQPRVHTVHTVCVWLTQVPSAHGITKFLSPSPPPPPTQQCFIRPHLHHVHRGDILMQSKFGRLRQMCWRFDCEYHRGGRLVKPILGVTVCDIQSLIRNYCNNLKYSFVTL